MPKDPAILAHQEWLGYVQPTGLVVSIPAMVDANASAQPVTRAGSPAFLDAAFHQNPDGEADSRDCRLRSIRAGRSELSEPPAGWRAPCQIRSPNELEVTLADYSETCDPRMRSRISTGMRRKWILLIEVLPTGN